MSGRPRQSRPSSSAVHQAADNPAESQLWRQTLDSLGRLPKTQDSQAHLRLQALFEEGLAAEVGKGVREKVARQLQAEEDSLDREIACVRSPSYLAARLYRLSELTSPYAAAARMTPRSSRFQFYSPSKRPPPRQARRPPRPRARRRQATASPNVAGRPRTPSARALHPSPERARRRRLWPLLSGLVRGQGEGQGDLGRERITRPTTLRSRASTWSPWRSATQKSARPSSRPSCR